MTSFLTEHKRTHLGNHLRATDKGREVTLYGWVHNRRDHGGRIFIDLRDRSGIVQVVFGPDIAQNAHMDSEKLRAEYCIAICGVIRLRSEHGGLANPRLESGEIEIAATKLHIFSESETPPFQIRDDVETREEVRLRHRYLDLRRPALQKNFAIRSQLYRSTRDYFYSQGFLEIETPFMGKYTPGGARNFLVPSRLHPKKFYALAESPQIYKQLFMVAGLEKYFQIVRCFRDEDLRMDRQPEFTQIDVEMSFIQENDVFEITEGLMKKIFSDTLQFSLKVPFERMTYQKAMDTYGEDKPDLRNPLKLYDLTAIVQKHQGGGVPLFVQALSNQGIIKVLHVPKSTAEQLSNSALKKLEEEAKSQGALGLAYARLLPELPFPTSDWHSPLAKTIGPALRQSIHEYVGAHPGDLLLFQFGRAKQVNTILSGLRNQLGKALNLLDKDAWRFVWITDFPLFERNEQGKWVAAHHPFTSPKQEHLDLLETSPEQVYARAYDLVLNGNEIGGGSIRNYQSDVQSRVFSVLGLSEEASQEKFGFLLEAFRYGPPPHGGIAFGVDRIAMLLCQASSLRDVIAFPKTQNGIDLMTECPTMVSKEQLKELSISSQE